MHSTFFRRRFVQSTYSVHISHVLCIWQIILFSKTHISHTQPIQWFSGVFAAFLCIPDVFPHISGVTSLSHLLLGQFAAFFFLAVLGYFGPFSATVDHFRSFLGQISHDFGQFDHFSSQNHPNRSKWQKRSHGWSKMVP